MSKTIETIKITTPVLEQEVEIRPYINALTSQRNQAVYLRYLNMDMGKAVTGAQEGKDIKPSELMSFDKLPADAIIEMQNNSIRGMVISVDGNSFDGDLDKLLDAVLAMPEKDYNFVKDEVDRIVGESSLDPKGKQK